MPDQSLPDSTKRNIAAIRDIENDLSGRRNGLERVSYSVTSFIGSFRFLLGQMLVVAIWIALNIVPNGATLFDPFPFEFLNFLVGVEAIVLSTFVLMTQNRQSREADHWAHLHLQINLLAEQETTKMLVMLQEISVKLGLNTPKSDRELQDMIQSTHVEELAKELEKTRDNESP
jgi:uncharacterized membrane protein